MLELIYTSRKTLTLPNTPWYYNGCWFIPTWDALLIRHGIYDYSKVYRDATAIVIAQWPMQFPSLGMMDGANLYGYSKRPGADGYWALPVDQFTLNCDRTYATPILPYRIDNFPNQKSLPFVDRERKILIIGREFPNAGLYLYDTETQALVGQILMPTWGYAAFHNGVKLRYVSPTKVAVIQENTYQATVRVAIVDWLAQEIDLDSKLCEYYYAEYDPKHQIFMAIDKTKKTRVYCLEIEPANLSNPEFVLAGDVHVLQARSIRVRLTGTENEPCPDWWVHWCLTQGLGALRRSISKTDQEGYAYNHYLAPTGIGSEIINAWVEV